MTFCDTCEEDVDECPHLPPKPTPENAGGNLVGNRTHLRINAEDPKSSKSRRTNTSVGPARNYGPTDSPRHHKTLTAPVHTTHRDSTAEISDPESDPPDSPSRSNGPATALGSPIPTRKRNPTAPQGNPQLNPPPILAPQDEEMADATGLPTESPEETTDAMGSPTEPSEKVNYFPPSGLTQEAFLAKPVTGADKSPYGLIPALNRNKLPKHIKLEGLDGAMPNNGNFPRLVVAKEHILKNVPPSQYPFLKLDDPKTFAIFDFCGGTQKFKARPDTMSRIGEKIKSLLPIDDLTVLLPPSRDLKLGTKNKYSPVRFGFATTGDVEHTKALMTIQTLIYDKDLAFHMIPISNGNFSWVVGLWECLQFPTKGTNDMRGWLRWGIYTTLFSNANFRNEADIATSSDERTRSERVSDVLVSIDAKFVSSRPGGEKRWLVTMKPCTENYERWCKLKDIVRSLDYRGGPFQFTLWEMHKKGAPPHRPAALRCTICDFDDHVLHGCPWTALPDYKGPDVGGAKLLNATSGEHRTAAKAWRDAKDLAKNQRDTDVEPAGGWESDEFLELEVRGGNNKKSTTQRRGRGRGGR